MTDINITRLPVEDLAAENTRLLGVIAAAEAALSRGEIGQAHRILKTGADTALLAVSEVLAGRHVL